MIPRGPRRSTIWPGRSARATNSGVEHARRAGDLLNRAKKELAKHGKWEDWVKENCSFKLRTAQNYMRIATHYEEVEEKLGPVEGLTMTQLLAVIKQTEDEEDADLLVGPSGQAGMRRTVRPAFPPAVPTTPTTPTPPTACPRRGTGSNARRWTPAGPRAS